MGCGTLQLLRAAANRCEEANIGEAESVADVSDDKEDGHNAPVADCTSVQVRLCSNCWFLVGANTRRRHPRLLIHTVVLDRGCSSRSGVERTSATDRMAPSVQRAAQCGQYSGRTASPHQYPLHLYQHTHAEIVM